MKLLKSQKEQEEASRYCCFAAAIATFFSSAVPVQPGRNPTGKKNPCNLATLAKQKIFYGVLFTDSTAPSQYAGMRRCGFFIAWDVPVQPGRKSTRKKTLADTFRSEVRHSLGPKI